MPVFEVLVTGAYASSWGHWGLLCHRQGDSIWLRDTSSTAELWALCDGTYSVMKAVRKNGKQPPLVLHCDNTAVVRWIELWTQGSRKMPNLPIIRSKKPYFHNARHTIQSWGAPITVVHTPRKQNQLQDACDQLARIAYDLNAYIISQAKAVTQIEAIVKRALA